jgi:hypothetical protein
MAVHDEDLIGMPAGAGDDSADGFRFVLGGDDDGRFHPLHGPGIVARSLSASQKGEM